MKKYAASLVLLLTFVPSFASRVQPNQFSQFRVHHSRATHQAVTKGAAHAQMRGARVPVPSLNLAAPKLAEVKPSLRSLFKPRPRPRGGAAIAPNFITAARTSMAGEDDDNTEPVMGDFNGDGKKDVAKVVDNDGTFMISLFLGNGDGTFQAAVQTNTPSNADDPIIVGDVNGDGKDDIIMVHPSEPASIDVLIGTGDGTFASPVNYPVTDVSLVGGVLTDINGDGKMDVLGIDNNNPANVIAVLGNGDGTFQAASTFTTLSTSVSGPFFADFNGDGNLDFATSNGQVQVFLGTGEGFADPVSLVTSDAAYNSCFNTVGDLTGDGFPEIVSVNCNLDTLTVYVNNGDGTFQTGVYYSGNFNFDNFPSEATIADVNGDGNNDVVVGNVDSGNISVFLGHGDGTLVVERESYGVGGFPWTTPLVADFNGDGLMDVVMPDDEFNLMYLQGYGDGTFRGSVNYELPNSFDQEAFSFDVATGDFNGDGIPDAVVGQLNNNGAPGIVVYLGRGDGTFLPGVNYGDNPNLAYVAVGDFNGDGRLDIAASDTRDGIVQIFMGNGDGTFNAGASYATDTASSPSPLNVVIGDFNHDGKLDLAIANAAAGTVGVLLGNGDGTFGNLASYPVTGFEPQSVTTADVNGDGYLDLLVPGFTDGPGAVGVLLANNDNSGTFQAVSFVTLTGSFPQYVAVGDLNKDGNPDLAITVENGTFGGDIEIALGNGDGTFQASTEYPSTALGSGSIFTDPANIQIVDLDGDGNPDLVYVNDEFGTIAVALGNGDGTINAPLEFSTDQFPWGMALADLNGDGAVDVVVANNESGGLSVLVNANGLGAAPNFMVGTSTPTNTVAAGASADYTINVAGLNGYNGTVTFSCGNLPKGVTCTFNPPSVIAQGSVTLSTIATLHTTGTTASLIAPFGANKPAPILFASLNVFGLFGLLLTGGSKKRTRKGAAVLLGLLLIVMLFTLVGCSDSSRPAAAPVSSATPAGSYNVTVVSTGTGNGAPTHNVSVTLVVQ